MSLRAHVFIIGRVQGVFFRSEAMNKAIKHNITGWIRNVPNGRVEAVFEGEKEELNAILAFCKRGPIGAKVERIDILFEPFTGEFKNFTIH